VNELFCFSFEFLRDFHHLATKMDDSNEPEDNGSGYKHKVEDIHEYETQFFGFTPKSFMDGGRFYLHRCSLNVNYER